MSSSTSSSISSLLLSPLRVGPWTLPNRVVFAPVTRCRADPVTRVPWARTAEYYAQRASVGLIIAEATSVDPMGVGFPSTPGIWTDEQVEGWKPITEAVHRAGGRILLQLWHVGRFSDPIYLNGALPVSASAIAAPGNVHMLKPTKPYVTPRALETAEIPAVVAAFRLGAVNAKRAGFDGVELHAGNSHLLEQFLSDRSNKRDDAYGGSRENRARLLLEVVDAIVSVFGADRMGVHLSPRGDVGDTKDSDPAAMYAYVARELRARQIAFLFVREARRPDSLLDVIKREFAGVVVANEEFTRDTAEQALADGVCDAVAFGRDMISNPDIVERFRRHAPLNPANASTFYLIGTSLPPETGYLDYPSLAPDQSASAAS